MKIGVQCPSCERSFEVAAEHAGKSGKCPHCKDPVRVPTQAATTPPIADPAEPDGEETYGLATEAATMVTARVRAAKAARVQTRVADEVAASTPTKDRPSQTKPTKRTSAEILTAFRGEIQRVRPTMAYRAWILVIAVVMVILPTIYLAMVAAVGYAVYWHAVHNIVIFQEVRQAKAALMVYGGPLAAGVIVLGFMLKPFFARAPKRSKVRKIDPDQEPLIVAYVDGVCQAVGAPTPSRIEVDCQVNASAHLASWVFSPSKELVLTIGLPLVAGLTLRQFTGVLAHEFGHFSQGAGMRLTVLIRSINGWFARVVYNRDEWDETLVGWSSDGHAATIIVALFARFAVWITRRVLWVLMYLGHVVSGFLARQMEFDADRYETRMVGCATFEATALQLPILGMASNAAFNELAANWRERRLPDDLSRLIMVKLAELPDALRLAINADVLKKKTGLFDTHPCDSDRIARSQGEQTDGIFRLDGPATDLFRDFDTLSRSTTFDFYRAMIGRDVTRDQLFPVAEAILNQEVEREGNQALDRFFVGSFHLIQPIPLPDSYPQPPADPKAAKHRLGELRRAMLAGRATNSTTADRWGAATGKTASAETAIVLCKVDKKFRAETFDLPRATLGAAEQALAAARLDAEQARTEFEPFGTAAAERLGLALGLLELDLVVDRVPDGVVLRDEARSLYPAAAALGGRMISEFGEFAPRLGAMQILIKLYQSGKNDQDPVMINALLRGSALVHERLTQLRWKLGDAVAYPFEHAHAGMTMGRFVLPSVPSAQAVGDVVQVANEAQERLLDLHRRVLGRLAATAEAVERAIGLAPVEIPEPAAD